MKDALQQLLDERDAARVVIDLFVATDRRDWAKVEACLAPRLMLDMTSLAGGTPQEVTGAALAAMWRDGLAPIDHVHHQVGNLVVTVGGDEANATCYGIALHHRKVASPQRTRVFVGSYRIHLVRLERRWRIDRFAFDLAFLEGNLELEGET
ncbi:MAG TPA: nuclear transport factor 2 family protein [Candidatus Polarisedimenticolaceae bacterium]|nr:nuclear transport factor 2 family protein [Candidatus Polarisedimenticolaceae bacterium]